MNKRFGISLDYDTICGYVLSAGNWLSLPVLKAWMKIHGRPGHVTVLSDSPADSATAAKLLVKEVLGSLAGEYDHNDPSGADRAHECLLGSALAGDRSLFGEKEITVRETTSSDDFRSWDIVLPDGRKKSYAATDGCLMRLEQPDFILTE